MAAVVSGSKTVTRDYSPALTGAALTTLLATAIENLTIAQLKQITDALARIPGGSAESTLVGTLLT